MKTVPDMLANRYLKNAKKIISIIDMGISHIKRRR